MGELIVSIRAVGKPRRGAVNLVSKSCNISRPTSGTHAYVRRGHWVSEKVQLMTHGQLNQTYTAEPRHARLADVPVEFACGGDMKVVEQFHLETMSGRYS